MSLSLQDYLLICLMEEAAELQQECAKALRFGIEHRYPVLDPTNREKIRHELNDLLAVVGVLRDCEILPAYPGLDEQEQSAKRRKLHDMMAYSRSQDRLGHDPQ